MENKKGDLYIPVRIKRYPEFWNIDGIGKKELRGILIMTGVGIIVGVISGVITQIILFPLLFVILFPSGAYMFLKKDLTNRNTIDKIRISKRFKKSQKRYDYKYYNIYEARSGRT